MQLLIKLPTRQRPQKALDLTEKYIEMISGNRMVYFVISTHANDATMNTTEVNDRVVELAKLAADKNVRLTHVRHDGTTKVHAYNSDPHVDQWDIQIATSDDMVPLIQGYDEQIVAAMSARFPNTKGVIHFNDGFSKLMTLPIVGRGWYDQFGYIYNPEYTSLFCDNEMEEVAKRLGQYHYEPRLIIRHEHPIHVHKPYDALMKHTESFYDADQAIFRARKRKQFGLKFSAGRWIVHPPRQVSQ